MKLKKKFYKENKSGEKTLERKDGHVYLFSIDSFSRKSS